MEPSILNAAVQLAQVLQTISNLTASATQVSALIQKAQQEGRTTFTPDEWKTIQGVDDASRQLLVQQITAALSK